MRAGDIVCRLGGDEFVCLPCGMLDAPQLAHLAGKLIDAVATPLALNGLHLEVRPSIGVAIFPQHADNTEARLKAGLTDPTTPLAKDKKLCEQLSKEHMDKVNEGIEMLNKSLEIKKDYDDAMAYMNLLYRERADYQCGDQAAREADLKMADEWVEKAKTTRQAKADKAKEQHGIVLDSPGTKQ